MEEQEGGEVQKAVGEVEINHKKFPTFMFKGSSYLTSTDIMEQTYNEARDRGIPLRMVKFKDWK